MQEAGAALLELQNRETLKLTGVQHIDVFEEERIVLCTTQGNLELQGQQLNITRLDLESGILQIEGNMDAMIYIDERRKRKNNKNTKQSFLQKMLS